MRKRHRAIATRGLNHNYNHRMKEVFKGAAVNGIKRGIFKQYYEGLLRNGIRAVMGASGSAQDGGNSVSSMEKRRGF